VYLHAATHCKHCNTLQHIATHMKSAPCYVWRRGCVFTYCDTLQHTATHCNAPATGARLSVEGRLGVGGRVTRAHLRSAVLFPLCVCAVCLVCCSVSVCCSAQYCFHFVYAQCCSVLQCVSVLQCAAFDFICAAPQYFPVLYVAVCQCVAVCCSVCQCVAVRGIVFDCIVLQCVSVCCTVWHCI